jgi:hypothetical protein
MITASPDIATATSQTEGVDQTHDFPGSGWRRLFRPDVRAAAVEKITPIAAQSTAAMFPDCGNTTPVRLTTNIVSPTPVVVTVSAKNTHSARRRSVATAAATNATAIAERYRAKETSVAPGSMLMLPVMGNPADASALFQIG